MKADDVITTLKSHANADDAVFLQRFFKTGEGQYGAGDVFMGVRVPDIRKVCAKFKSLSLKEVQVLLDSDIHECRLAGLIILVNAYKKATDEDRQEIYNLYMDNVEKGRVNNWDLVDLSAPGIVGEHLKSRSHEVLVAMAKSDNLWEKRVAVLSTFTFLKEKDAKTTLQIAKILMGDTHDLIHKAVGWMLRETGKQVGEKMLTDFLEQYYRVMPRTMLRYAIERLSVEQKAYFMKR